MALASREDLLQLAWTSPARPSAPMRGRIVALAARALTAFEVGLVSEPTSALLTGSSAGTHRMHAHSWTKSPDAGMQLLNPWCCMQAHVFRGVGGAAAVLEAAFEPPLVDFSALILLRAACVPGSELQMRPDPSAAEAPAGMPAASALCQGVPYGEQGFISFRQVTPL